MADPSTVGVSVETVTKITTNVKTCSLELLDPNFLIYYTYKLTGETAPTKAEMIQEMQRLFDTPERATTESFSYQAAVDLYLYSTDKEVNGTASAVNKSILSVSADLITGDSTVVTINGNATTATAWGTSHADTMAAIAVKVAALDDVLSATVDTRSIIVLMDKNAEIATSDITVTSGGAGTAVGSEVNSIACKIRVDA